MQEDGTPDALPEGVVTIRLSARAMAIANVILQAVKSSSISVTQLEQETTDVSEAVMNGVVNAKDLSLADHYDAVQKFSALESKKRALYMHNKSLIEVAGADLVHRLYKAVHPLKQDVLVNYPLLYISDNPKSSNDVLVGSKGSWSPVHQDLPLYCTSAILVLEGHKEFVVVQDSVVPSLRINLASGSWNEPITHEGQTFPNLQALVHATGGAVLHLKAGDLMVMPPRVFHLARNCAPTVSCNFSICTMESIPLTMAQTLARIEQSPRDVMHFDCDVARLLEDCTNTLVQQAQVRAANIVNMTSRKRLPPIRAILNNSVRLMEWYMTLQCIPKDWVVGFWGEVRDRVLGKLLGALPLHSSRADGLPGTGNSGPDMCAVVPDTQPGPAAAAVAPSQLAAVAVGNGAAVPRPLSLPRMARQRLAKVTPLQVQDQQDQQMEQQMTVRGLAGRGTVARRSARSDRAAVEAATAGAGESGGAGAGKSGGAAAEAAPPRKKAKSGREQEAAGRTALAL